MAKKPAARRAAGHNDVISTLGWLGTLLVLIIPIVGLVVYIIWAIGNDNLNRRNYARASLILVAASIILGILSSVVFALILKPLMGTFQGLF